MQKNYSMTYSKDTSETVLLSLRQCHRYGSPPHSYALLPPLPLHHLLHQPPAPMQIRWIKLLPFIFSSIFKKSCAFRYHPWSMQTSYKVNTHTTRTLVAVIQILDPITPTHMHFLILAYKTCPTDTSRMVQVCSPTPRSTPCICTSFNSTASYISEASVYHMAVIWSKLFLTIITLF